LYRSKWNSASTISPKRHPKWLVAAFWDCPIFCLKNGQF
jgi:hypothetical protein